MKTTIFGCVLCFLSLLCASLSAQSVILDAESTFPGVVKNTSNNKAFDLSNCWSMTADIDYTTSSQGTVIAGVYSMKTSGFPIAASWIASPWLQPKSGNITLKAKLSSVYQVTGRKIDFYYIPYESNSVNFEGTAQLIYTYNWSSISTDVNNVSIPMPSSLVDATKPYKIKMVFGGSGGSAYILFDDLVLPAENKSNPADCGGTPLSEQTVLNAETTFPGISNSVTNNRLFNLAYCWSMTDDIVYITGSGGSFSGSYSLRTTSGFPTTSSWVTSPWVQPKSGNITLKAKLSSTASVSSRKIDFYYIPYGPSSGNYEGTPVLFYTYNWSVLSTEVNNISVQVPAGIIDASTPYKIKMTFGGTGGSAFIIFDDYVLSADYKSDPTHCGGRPILPDADGDGVMDSEDAYPNDATRAYDLYVPAAGYGTLMFEDLWPNQGDYDLNDEVLAYRHHIVTSATNKVVTLTSTFTLKAVGGFLRNGFAFQLNNIAPSKIVSVSGVDSHNPSWWSLSSNGTESGQAYANILLFDDAVRVLPPPGNSFTNTVLSEPYATPVTYNVLVTFAANQVDYAGGLSYNPYIIVQQVRGNEVHLAGQFPTSKANTDLFGTGDDNSSVSAGRYYKSKTNLPWGLDIPKDVPYGQEEKDLIFGYLKLAPWAQSDGELYPDWYENLSGYRVPSKLYIR